MKYVNSWSHLEPYGLHLLTGEACGLMYRLLFDVTRQGLQVLEKCLGVTLMLAEPWNSGSPDDPHLGSILLPQSMFLPLGVFGLLETGCTEVWLVGEGLIGFEPTDSADQRERTALVYAERLGRIFRYAGCLQRRVDSHLANQRLVGFITGNFTKQCVHFEVKQLAIASFKHFQ